MKFIIFVMCGVILNALLFPASVGGVCESTPYKGIDSLQSALDSNSRAKNKGNLEQIISTDQKISALYATKGKWQKAINYLKEKNVFVDSLESMKHRNLLEKAEEKAMVERSLAIQRAEKDKKETIQAAEMKFKVTLLILIIIGLFTAGILWVQIKRYRRTIRKNKAMHTI